jgi:hypothetical protein
MATLTPRAEAEAIEAIGDGLMRLDIALDKLCNNLDAETITLIEAVEHQEHLSTIAKGLQALGDRLCRELDEAEGAA